MLQKAHTRRGSDPRLLHVEKLSLVHESLSHKGKAEFCGGVPDVVRHAVREEDGLLLDQAQLLAERRHVDLLDVLVCVRRQP